MLAREKERSLKEEKRRSLLLLYKGIQWTGFFFHFLFRNELLCDVRKRQNFLSVLSTDGKLENFASQI
jgi:hypothetical protein